MYHAVLLRSVAATLLVAISTQLSQAAEREASFAEFDRRAKAGERLSVVFFGASLTWGANATDPQLTSFRGQFAQRLEEAYPLARFKFWDAAIGGTGSQLGVFRFDRDVLAHKPDLVLLDFSANDDIYSDDAETLASYESLVRRIIVDAKAPVIQVVFPFLWNVTAGKLDGMKRREAHHAISHAYHTAIGDAIALAVERVAAGKSTTQRLWPADGVHPGNAGYELFTDAAWSAFQQAVAGKLVCRPPAKMLYADTYMTNRRVRISGLKPLPAGWRIGAPNLVSAYFDMLMSRWLDDEVIAGDASATADVKPADAKPADTQPGDAKPTVPAPHRLKLQFRGSMVMLFGESTPKSGKYRAYIDGKLVEHRDGGADKPHLKEFDAGHLGRMLKGNAHLVQVIATGLDPAEPHTLEIEPAFDAADQELRLESVCVAGGAATVTVE